MAENSDQNPSDQNPVQNPVEADHAQPPEALRRGMKKALLIGVSQYVAGWRSLPAAKGDAEMLQQLLTNPNVGNFDEVKLLLDPDRQHVEEEVYALAVNSQPHDLLLIYFSGWGRREENGKLYLATSITRKDPSGELNKPTAILLGTLQELLNHGVADQQVVILDSCFESAVNSIAPQTADPQTENLDLKTQIGGPNRAVLTASAATSYTSEQKQADCSLYTKYLIEGVVTGAASRAVANQVTLQELHAYAKQRVQAAAPAIEPMLYLPQPEFDPVLTQAPDRTAQMVYRQYVETHSRGGETTISDFDRLILNWRRDRLGLSPETTAEVEKAVLQPYEDRQQKLRQYRQKLNTIVGYQYPLRATTLAQLKQLRQRFGLVKDQTEAIATETIAPYEQQHQQNLDRFEQHLIRELEQNGYPLDRNVRNELRYLEQQLHLKSADVAEVQHHVITAYQERYQHHLEQYEQSLRQAIAHHYPLDDRTRYELRQQQQLNRLKDEDVAAIAAQISQSTDGITSNLEAVTATAPELNPEEYQHNIHQYRQYFISRLQPSRPLDEVALEELRSLQHVLRLRAADVAQAEAEGTQEKLNDYDQKLQQYEQEFYRIAETDLSDPANRDRLTWLQHELGLAEPDVALVEKIALELLDRKTVSDDRPEMPNPAAAVAPEPSAIPDSSLTPDLADSQPAQIVTESEIADTQLQPPSVIEDSVEDFTAPVDDFQPAAAFIQQEDAPARENPLPIDTLPTRPSRTHPTAVASSPIWVKTNKPIIEQLRTPQSRFAAVIRIIRAVGLAVLAIAVGRILITQLLLFLPVPIGRTLGVILFALSILLAWKALNLLN